MGIYLNGKNLVPMGLIGQISANADNALLSAQDALGKVEAATAISTVVSGLSDEVSGISSVVSSISGEITSISGLVDEVSGLSDEVSGLSDVLSGLSGEVADISGQITSIQGVQLDGDNTFTGENTFTEISVGKFQIEEFPKKKILIGQVSTLTGNVIGYSDDGIEWNELLYNTDIDIGTTLYSVAEFPNKETVIITDKGIFYSTDGLIWNKSTSSTNGARSCVVYSKRDNKLFLIVGHGSGAADYPKILSSAGNGDDWGIFQASLGSATEYVIRDAAAINIDTSGTVNRRLRYCYNSIDSVDGPYYAIADIQPTQPTSKLYKVYSTSDSTLSVYRVATVGSVSDYNSVFGSNKGIYYQSNFNAYSIIDIGEIGNDWNVIYEKQISKFIAAGNGNGGIYIAQSKNQWSQVSFQNYTYKSDDIPSLAYINGKLLCYVRDSTVGKILYSEDGGETWQVNDSPKINTIKSGSQRITGWGLYNSINTVSCPHIFGVGDKIFIQNDDNTLYCTSFENLRKQLMLYFQNIMN